MFVTISKSVSEGLDWNRFLQLIVRTARRFDVNKCGVQLSELCKGSNKQVALCLEKVLINIIDMIVFLTTCIFSNCKQHLLWCYHQSGLIKEGKIIRRSFNRLWENINLFCNLIIRRDLHATCIPSCTHFSSSLNCESNKVQWDSTLILKHSLLWYQLTVNR